MVTTSQADPLLDVEVHDPGGQRSVVLGIRRNATAAEVRARALAALNLPDEVDWNLREEQTGRLLLDEQQLGEFAEEARPIVELSMQPDAGLG